MGALRTRPWLSSVAACAAASWLVGCVTAGGGGRPPEVFTSHLEPELVGEPSPGTAPEPRASHPAGAPRRHRVAAGETLYRIARAHGLTAEELAAANGNQDPRTLSVGQELIIPAPARAGPPALAASESGPPAASSRLARPPPRPATVGSPAGTLDWPLRGVLYGRFGRKGREPHDGIDLAAPSGTPLKTAAGGTVLYAGEQKGYGLIAIVEHPGGLVTLYAHNRDLRVKTGQKVRPGQVIATVGESGRTSGPHLHFEVRKEGIPVDPLLHLRPFDGPPRSGR